MKCPTCGSPVRVEGKTTQYYVPVTSDGSVARDVERAAENWADANYNHSMTSLAESTWGPIAAKEGFIAGAKWATEHQSVDRCPSCGLKNNTQSGSGQ